MRSKFLIACAALFALIALAGTLLPGPHRALWPAAAGLHQIAPGIWADDPAEAEALLETVVTAQARIAPFWGFAPRPRRLLLCTTRPCADRFALRPLGISYGTALVILGPDGVNPVILAHELSHIALNRRLGLRDLIDPRFPIWFNEGLASHLSPDPRYLLAETPRDADWVRTLRTPGDWSDRVTGDNYAAVYGAAATLVRHIDATLGRDGLRRLVADVTDGADFDTTLATRMAAHP